MSAAPLHWNTHWLHVNKSAHTYMSPDTVLLTWKLSDFLTALPAWYFRKILFNPPTFQVKSRLDQVFYPKVTNSVLLKEQSQNGLLYMYHSITYQHSRSGLISPCEGVLYVVHVDRTLELQNTERVFFSASMFSLILPCIITILE